MKALIFSWLTTSSLISLLILLTILNPTSSTNQRGIDYLSNLVAKDANVKITESGLHYKVLQATTLDVRLIYEYNKPKDDTVVVIHYKGKTIDNKVFDNTYRKNITIRTRPKELLQGIKEAITCLMEVGTKLELYVPSELGYGEKEVTHGGIKKGDVLIFVIELVEIDWDGKVRYKLE